MKIGQYLAELQKVELLAPEKEQALWQAFKERDDRAARQCLIESYQPLVFKTALPWRARENLMDILQEGTVGLIEAAESYDWQRGVAFSLFAVHRIRGRMVDFLKKEGKSDIACMDSPLEDGREPWELLPDMALPVAEQAEAGLLRDELHRALERLPQKERLVLESVYLKSEEVTAVAEFLHVSASHIYRLQKSGIRRVRGMLARFMRH
ncbi:sigma-70 family RNA polymerase sigma factor [Selenomonas sputigena]|uniref:Sigma-70 family RNA polymerase sigma factor n=1 Tax=Selenomonas sputigena TaxID=69823 RepID=A0ABV3X3K3_9FIRM